MSVRPESQQEDEDSDGSDGDGSAPSTPKRTKRVNSKTLGTIETPLGRRSARIARRRKED